MIDNLEKADLLIEKLKTVIPIRAKLSPSLINLLTERSPDVAIPDQCNIIDVFYTGDEGGIICCLDIGGPNNKNPHLVSITHLGFDRNVPLSRDIAVYQHHRIKKLKKQDAQGRH